MPDPNLSAAIKEAYASVPADQVILHTLSLYHPSWFDTTGNKEGLYFVKDHANFHANIEKCERFDSGKKVMFHALAFNITMPEVKQTTVPEITLNLDQVSGILIPYLDLAASSREKITLIYRPYLSTDTTGPQMIPPLELILSAISVNSHTLQAKARITDMGGRAFPNIEYNLKNFPALANF